MDVEESLRWAAARLRAEAIRTSGRGRALYDEFQVRCLMQVADAIAAGPTPPASDVRCPHCGFVDKDPRQRIVCNNCGERPEDAPPASDATCATCGGKGYLAFGSYATDCSACATPAATGRTGGGDGENIMAGRDQAFRLWHAALRQYGNERVLRRQWQDRTIHAETLLRRCTTLGALPCELRRQIATALDPRPCGCGPTDGCDKCRKPGALYQAILQLWFVKPDGSAPSPLTDPPDEVTGVMQDTREQTAAFLSEVVLRHWDGVCRCQTTPTTRGRDGE